MEVVKIMLQSFKLAIKSIIANKMRSFLTMLGLIIGVSAVVILVSVMMGYLNNMVKSFMDMGANTISVSLVNTPARQASIDQMYDFFNENRDIFCKRYYKGGNYQVHKHHGKRCKRIL